MVTSRSATHAGARSSLRCSREALPSTLTNPSSLVLQRTCSQRWRPSRRRARTRSSLASRSPVPPSVMPKSSRPCESCASPRKRPNRSCTSSRQRALARLCSVTSCAVSQAAGACFRSLSPRSTPRASPHVKSRPSPMRTPSGCLQESSIASLRLQSLRIQSLRPPGAAAVWSMLMVRAESLRPQAALRPDGRDAAASSCAMCKQT